MSLRTVLNNREWHSNGEIPVTARNSFESIKIGRKILKKRKIFFLCQ